VQLTMQMIFSCSQIRWSCAAHNADDLLLTMQIIFSCSQCRWSCAAHNACGVLLLTMQVVLCCSQCRLSSPAHNAGGLVLLTMHVVFSCSQCRWSCAIHSVLMTHPIGKDVIIGARKITVTISLIPLTVTKLLQSLDFSFTFSLGKRHVTVVDDFLYKKWTRH
jgi:hypothetical protein